MVYVPYPPGYPTDVPETHVDAEMFENRRITLWFINEDPTEIILIPRGKTRLASGGYVSGDLEPRDVQTFKFVYGGSTGGGRAGIVKTGDGTERMFSYVLIGAYDAEIGIGDHWTDGEQHWEVEEILPYNGYELKATIRSYGGDPQNG